MLKKRILACMMAGLMLGGTLSGMSVSAEGTTSDLTGEVRYAFWAEAQKSMLEEQVAAFNEIYPNVTIKLELTGWNEFWLMLETAATGGTAADVFWLNADEFGKYASAGILLPIDDYIEESGIDLSKYPAGLVEFYSMDGVQYGIPKDHDVTGIYYNKEIFDAYGVEYPTDDWTWDDLMEVAGKLTDSEKNLYGFCSVPGQIGHYASVAAAGGYVISDDRKSSGYTTPETMLGIQSLLDVVEAGYSPTTAQLQEYSIYDRFINGELAMIPATSNYISDCVLAWGREGLEEHLGAVSWPSIGGNKGTIVHGLINAIYAGTENADAAWAWVEFLSKEQGMDISSKYVTAALEGYDVKWAETYPGVNLESFIEAAEYADGHPGSNGTEWISRETDILNKVFNLEMDVETACAELEKVVNECLANE